MSQKRGKTLNLMEQLREVTEEMKETTEKLRNLRVKQQATNELLKVAVGSLKGALTNSRAALDRLHNLENSFPRTKEFLKQRGLVDVRQLDSAGWKALAAFYRAPQHASPASQTVPTPEVRPAKHETMVTFQTKGSSAQN